MRKVLIIKFLITIGILAYAIHPVIGLAANLAWLWIDL